MHKGRLLAVFLLVGLAATASAWVAPLPRPRLDRHGDPLPEGALLRLGTLRWRAVGEVEALAFSPDGKLLATAAAEGLCLFDSEGKLIRHVRLGRGTFDFDRLAFSPDGKRLACRTLVRGKEVVQVREIPDGKVVNEHDAEALVWLGWSRDGKLLGAMLAKGAVLFRDFSTGKEKRLEADTLRDPIVARSIRASVAGGLLAVPGDKGIVHVWDVVTGKKRQSLQTKGELVQGAAIAPDGRSLATLSRVGNDFVAQLWDVGTGKAQRTLNGGQKYIREGVFSPDGKTLATVGLSDVWLHDVKAGRVQARIKGAASFGPCVSFSPDGKTLATVPRHSGTVYRWDTATGATRSKPAGHAAMPGHVAFSPDGRTLASGGSMDGTVIVWEATTGKELVRIKERGWGREVAFSPNGRFLYTSWANEKVLVHDAKTGQEQYSLKIDDPDDAETKHSAFTTHLSDDGKALVTFSHGSRRGGGGAGGGGLISGFDVVARKRTFTRRAAIEAWYAVSPDVKLLAFAEMPEREQLAFTQAQGPIRIVNLRTGETLLSLSDVKFQTWPLAFSPDGRLLVTFTTAPGKVIKPGKRFPEREYTMRVWELHSGGEVLALPAESINNRVAFSRDGSILALTAPDGVVQIWDLRQGKERQCLKGIGSRVISLAFSPDGTRLVTGLDNTTLLLWDVTAPSDAKLTADALTRAWGDLAGERKKAFAAQGMLIRSPTEALPFLKARLMPAKAADAATTKRSIADLDSDTFEVREAARKKLEALGDAAASALHEAQAGKPSVEVYRRIEELLKRLRPPFTQGETLRSLRVVAVLEGIGNNECRKVLKSLSEGAAKALLTEEAKAALRRIDRR